MSCLRVFFVLFFPSFAVGLPLFLHAIKAEDERKAREREERRRQERLRREDFKEFLQGMVEENAITADTTWKDLKRSIEEEAAYTAMEDQPGGARDVFDDIVADLRRQVHWAGQRSSPNC